MVEGVAARVPTREPEPIERRVYAVWGVPPETQAYAVAKYSRSSQGMLESVAELSSQKAEQFLNTFYFQYGHRSIADLAHLAVAFEHVSILAAIEVVDEQLWDGQERSTRYQNFNRTRYHLPESVDGGPAERQAEHREVRQVRRGGSGALAARRAPGVEVGVGQE